MLKKILFFILSMMMIMFLQVYYWDFEYTQTLCFMVRNYHRIQHHSIHIAEYTLDTSF